MTFASKGAGGSTGSSTANQSSIALTTATTNMAAGDFGVLLVAGDNNATTTGDEGMVTSVTDSAGNNWSKAIEFCNPSASPAAQAGATCSLWFTNAKAALNTGGTITANLSNNTSRDAMTIAFWVYTKATGQIGLPVGTNTRADNAADPGSLDVTTSAVSHLRIRGIASETNVATTITVTSTWTSWALATATGASAAAGSTVRAEHLISAAANAASDPTYVSADHASVYAAFEEATIMGQAIM